MTLALLNPRLDRIASMTPAPLPNSVSETRSLSASNELTKVAGRVPDGGPPAADRAGHVERRATDRPCAASLHRCSSRPASGSSPSFMNVVGSDAVAVHGDDVDAGRRHRSSARRSRRRRSDRARRRPEIAGRKVRLEDRDRLGARVAAVQRARRAERRAVHRLRQLRLDHVASAAVDRQAGEQAASRQDARPCRRRQSPLRRRPSIHACV